MRKTTGNFLTENARALPPSGIRHFFDLVRQTQGVISLGIGEPDFATPAHITDISFAAAMQGETMYTSNMGTPELRKEIKNYLNGMDLDYDWEKEILVTVGVSEAVDLALRVLLEKGDEILMPDPSYVSYAPLAGLVGGKVVFVPTFMEDAFRLNPVLLEKALTPQSKILMLTFPNNPTGAVMDREDLEKIAEIAIRHDLFVISDEIYCELTHDGNHVSIASLPGMKERTLVLNGFSKTYAMTGWRIGYAAGPGEIIEAMNKIHQYSIMCAPVMAQRAATAALRYGGEDKRKMCASYRERRKIMVEGLRIAGLECIDPKGAFYAFPSIACTGLSSEEFAEQLLREEKVAVIPGTAFGPGGEGFVRCCYAAAEQDIREALKRIRKFTAGHTGIQEKAV